ncbi:MAG: hypothetical protein J6V14_02025 [Clostridia bacterium]|jgi:hypothetical protein|nr:hypothetical protein [Clostridia bacterium]
MNTLETVLLWPVIFILIASFVVFGVRALTVTERQIEYYETLKDGPSPSDITRLVEVAHDVLEEIG